MEHEFLQNFLDSLTQSSEPLLERFHGSLQGGNNTLSQNVVSEAVTLRDDWVITIDAALYSVERIVQNPKKFIAEEEIVVDVERSKKTSAKTMRHLAMNTRDVSSIEADGTVKPRRVLNVDTREELGIYENRFVAALVDRLVIFVENRYHEVKDKCRVHDVTNVGMQSKFHYGQAEMTYQLNVSMKEPPHDKVLLEKNIELLNRIQLLRKRVRIIQGSDFIKKLSLLKPVHAPIVKTNIIRMNVDYRNCYQLWLFISSYSFVGYSVEVRSKTLPIDGDYYDDLTVLAALSFQTLIKNRTIRAEEFEEIPFSEPKVKTYKIAKDIEYKPTFAEDKKKVDVDVINEYYFNRMKQALKGAAEKVSGAAVVEERELNVSFGRFFRAVTAIANDMYVDLIKQQTDAKSPVRRSPLAKREAEYKQQLKIYSRYKLLGKLKQQELERFLKQESKELIKLEKTKFELDKARKKAIDKKKAKELEKKKLAAIEARKNRMLQRAEEHEGELLDQELQRRAELAEQRRQKTQEAKRRRELRQLERLKEKYEENGES